MADFVKTQAAVRLRFMPVAVCALRVNKNIYETKQPPQQKVFSLLGAKVLWQVPGALVRCIAEVKSMGAGTSQTQLPISLRCWG